MLCLLSALLSFMQEPSFKNNVDLDWERSKCWEHAENVQEPENWSEWLYLDCSQSPYFSVGFSRPVRFDGTGAILVCKSERDLGRVSKLPRGAGVSVSIVIEGKRKNIFPAASQLRSPPLGSLDTLPRSYSLLQTKMAAAPSKLTGLENPTEK